MTSIKDTLVHRWLNVPYVLNTSIKRPATLKKTPIVLFLHGIGNSGEAWREIIEKLPPEYLVITIDLLGFGKSPRPAWAKYDAKLQARAVIATYLRLRIRGRVVIVGHSLGALVAVEMAKRYPLLVKSLILCSPPFYKVDESKRRLLPSSDYILRDMYRLAKKHPDQFMKISMLAAKLGLVNKSYRLTRDDAPTYMNALEATIINQTSLNDALKLKTPVQILYGRLDPVVVGKNLRLLAKKNKNVQLTTILAGHEIIGVSYIDATVAAITRTAPITKR